MHQKANPAAGGAATGRETFDLAVGGSVPSNTSTARPPAPAAPAQPAAPVLHSVRPGPGKPFLWLVTIGDGRSMILKTCELQSYRSFRRLLREMHGVECAPLSADAWCAILDEALRPLRDGKAVVS